LPLIPLIMWSRVYNGMHWPIDTILGVILGLAIADLSLIVINLIF
jgi:membrane-associated phospholipid phosphatase